MAEDLVFEIVEGAVLPALELQVIDDKGQVVNLTGYGSPETTMCTLEGVDVPLGGTTGLTGVTGTFKYNWVTADTDTPDQYLIRVSAVLNGKKIKFPIGKPVRVSIIPDCP